MIPLLMLNQPCNTAVAVLTQSLHDVDLRTVSSFDSRKVRLEKTAVSPPCPHHADTACDCQIVVLLVYGSGDQPATLIAHGQDGKTWITMAARANQRQPALENKITRAITKQNKSAV